MTAPLFGAPREAWTTDEYYTPEWVFETLDTTFDLDVAAPAGGVPWIPATRHYTIAEDGLAQPWEGFVWMNPPFSKASQWARRFLEHGNGIALLPMAKSNWTGDVWNTATAIHVPIQGSMEFVNADGGHGRISSGIWLVGMGVRSIRPLWNMGRLR